MPSPSEMVAMRPLLMGACAGNAYFTVANSLLFFLIFS